MKKVIRKLTSGILTMVLTMSFSLVASADSPTEIYVNTPGNTTVDIPEESTSGSIVFSVQTDADPFDISFYEQSVVNPATSRFNIDLNGNVTVVNSNNIDFENGDTTYFYPIQAQEDGGVTIQETITINLEDVNEAPNITTFNTLRRYEEQGDDGIVFYSESANVVSDEDATDDPSDLTFTELACTDNLGGDCSGIFTFGVETVDIFGSPTERFTIYQPDYDYEDRGGVDYYDLNIRATDDEGLSNSDVIRIQNANIGEIDDATSEDDDGLYGIGDTINIDVNISDSDTLYYYNDSDDPNVAPTLDLNLDTGTASAELTTALPLDTSGEGGINLATGTDEDSGETGPGSPVTFLRFLYTVIEGQSAADLDYDGIGALDMGTAYFEDEDFAEDNFSGTYYFENGPGHPVIPTDLPTPGVVGSLSFAKDIVIDGIRPFINNAVGSDVETVHGEGDTIEVVLEYDNDIDLSGYDYGSTIDLDVGGTIVTATDNSDLTSTLAANQLGFTYIVGPDLLDLDGIDVVENSFSGGTISDLAGNNQTSFTHSSFNLPNDLVGVLSQPTRSGSSSTSGNTASPFNTEEPTEEDTPPETDPQPEEEINEPDEEPVVEEVDQPEEVGEEPVNEAESGPTPTFIEPVEPVVPTTQPEPVIEEPVYDEPTEATSENSEDDEPNDRTPAYAIENCPSFDTEREYPESLSLECDPSEEFIMDESAGRIQLNLPRYKNTKYNSNRFVVTGKVFDQEIETVEIFAMSNNNTVSLGYADVDEAGKFLLHNVKELPMNEIITLYGKDVDTPTQSPDYGLEIDRNMPMIGVNLISFANKNLNRLYESDDSEVDYWTFISTTDVENDLLAASVKSEFQTYHKAYWQSVMYGSSAITGSNSDETTLTAPNGVKEELRPFSKHRVTILAERANAMSVPLVVEYYVLPVGFVPGVAILLLLIACGAWYFYQKKQKNEMSNETTTDRLQSY